MSTLVPTTELEAVNAMLRIIGEPPANTLTAPTRADVTAAVDALDDASRNIQQTGWYWNSENEVLHSNAGAPNYYITLPSNTLSARVSARSLDSTTSAYVYRNGRLYNSTDRTYSFEDLGPFYLDLIVLVTFEELPEAARRAIFRRAAIDFQQGALNANAVGRVTEQMAVEAWAKLLEDECYVGRHQLTSGPGQFELHYRR